MYALAAASIKASRNVDPYRTANSVLLGFIAPHAFSRIMCVYPRRVRERQQSPPCHRQALRLPGIGFKRIHITIIVCIRSRSALSPEDTQYVSPVNRATLSGIPQERETLFAIM